MELQRRQWLTIVYLYLSSPCIPTLFIAYLRISNLLAMPLSRAQDLRRETLKKLCLHDASWTDELVDCLRSFLEEIEQLKRTVLQDIRQPRKERLAT